MDLLFPEASLIAEAFRAGDHRAYRFIYGFFFSDIHRFSSSIVQDEARAEDIAQDVFVVLWKKCSDFISLKNIKAFLYISTRNACINYLRTKKRERSKHAGLSHYLAGTDQPPISQLIVQRETSQQILRQIETLPPRRQQIIRLHFLEGLSNTMIADQLHLSVHTVKSEKHKAVKALRIRLKKPDLEGVCFRGKG